MTFNQVMWLAVLLGLLLLSLVLSWQLSVQADYGFRLWYWLLDIEQHIHAFGPQNHFKPGFELLPKSEHLALFHGISQAVHQQGQGLEVLSYPWQGQAVALLTQAERVHLQDVANLIGWLEYAVRWLAAGTTVLLVWLLKRGYPPNWRAQLKLLVSMVALILLGVWMLGAERVFYQLHIWIFPEQHQWFFYYQESLMSTLMKAPDLFAAIALQILAGATVIYTALLLLLARVVLPKYGLKRV